jgi:hypothetical protein
MYASMVVLITAKSNHGFIGMTTPAGAGPGTYTGREGQKRATEICGTDWPVAAAVLRGSTAVRSKSNHFRCAGKASPWIGIDRMPAVLCLFRAKRQAGGNRRRFWE